MTIDEVMAALVPHELVYVEWAIGSEGGTGRFMGAWVGIARCDDASIRHVIVQQLRGGENNGHLRSIPVTKLTRVLRWQRLEPEHDRVQDIMDSWESPAWGAGGEEPTPPPEDFTDKPCAFEPCEGDGRVVYHLIGPEDKHIYLCTPCYKALDEPTLINRGWKILVTHTLAD